MSEVKALAQNLVDRMKDKTGDETDLMFGVVTSTSPLTIRVDNRFEIGSDFLILSQMVKPLEITVKGQTTSAGGGGTHKHGIKVDGVLAPKDKYDLVDHTETPHTHKSSDQVIKLWDGLAQGEKVLLLRVQGGQLFYVLERG